jgi:tRNA-Thr(GGU) m(6)t(6)A37 methyltransferase TsaA
MHLTPVGVVRSPVTERKKMPAWGVNASVEVYPQFADALLRIEKHSHLWILAWLDKGPSRGKDERHVLQVTPRGVVDPGPEGLHGVFAVRSPARPNPIGLSAARVTSIDGLVIRFDHLDFLDATPVIDLKPYFITRDMIFSASGRQVGSPSSREALRESLVIQAVHFHGALTPQIALAVRIVEHYRHAHHALNDVPAWSLDAPAAMPGLIDGLMGITRASLGRGSLRIHAGPDLRINAHAVYTPHALLPATVLDANDEDLFDYLPLP